MVDSAEVRSQPPTRRSRRSNLATVQPGAAPSRVHNRGRNATVVLLVALAVASSLYLTLPRDQSTRLSTRLSSPTKLIITTAAPTPVTPTPTPQTPTTQTTTTSTPTTSTPTKPVPAPAAVPTAPTEPSVTSLVAEVEATGVEPGSNWTWSMADTATHCGDISGAGTGCTFGAAGLEYSVFSGSPTLALVAHELANAETQNDAVPSLLNEVAVAENGTSWSPTDAVASCLVEHFMGFQDNSAGTWQCPAVLADIVADNIHDTLSAPAVSQAS